jgi:O-antigen ligase
MRRGVARARTAVGSRRTLPWVLLYSLWIVVLLDPQWWVAAHGPAAVLRLPTLLFPVVVLAAALAARRFHWYPVLACYVLNAIVTIPFAPNPIYAFEMARKLTLFYALLVATVSLVRTFHQALPILLLMFLYQFAWWGLHGGTSGLVSWHPLNANSDGFGPVMVMGMGLTYHFATAARSARFRWMAYIVAGICVFDVVASFARGAVLAAALLVGLVWLRSRRKGAATLGLVGALLIVVVASGRLFPGGTFWTEMESAFTEGTTEGTGADRWDLWSAAVRVWMQRPVFGVGGDNFGPFAATFFGVGEVGGEYAANPHRLYDRQLHSVYFQMLSEFGLVGCGLFLGVLWDFFRRNRALRSTLFKKQWEHISGGQFDIRGISYGLEAGMLAYLATGFFYDQLDVHWVFTLVAVNGLVYSLARPAAHPRTRRLAGHHARSG